MKPLLKLNNHNTLKYGYPIRSVASRPIIPSFYGTTTTTTTAATTGKKYCGFF